MTTGPSLTARIVESAVAERRIACALDWLTSRGTSEEVLVIAASGDAANELVRVAALRRGAAFGWHRMTLDRLTAALATPVVTLRGLAPIGALAAEAVVARVVHELREESSLNSDGASLLGRYAPVADSPGFPRALSRTLAELRLAGATPEQLAEQAPELARLCEAVVREQDRAGLADRASMLKLATAAALDPKTPAPAGLVLGLPTLLLDVPLRSAAEAGLVAALAARSPTLLATVATGDAGSRARLMESLGQRSVEQLDESGEPGECDGPREHAELDEPGKRDEREESRQLDEPDERDAAPERSNPHRLVRLQRELFSGDSHSGRTAVGGPDSNDGLTVLSAPGESRECVEIARRVAAFAEAGVPFDQIAVLLRSPDEYRPHLQEAFRRADIPVHFARGVVQPDPAGRAFLALLACAAEGLSARRFAEYLSLGELPDATESGASPPPAASDESWVPPDGEFVSERVARALERGSEFADPQDAADSANSANSTNSADSTDSTEMANSTNSADSTEMADSTNSAGGTNSADSKDPAELPDSADTSQASAATTDPANPDNETAAVDRGVLRAPRRWERLLVEAAVIGGIDRWERRLAGLEQELTLQIRAQIREAGDPDDAKAEAMQSSLHDLAALRAYALPLLRVLDGLTSTRSSWGQWLSELAALATSSLRQPERVLAVLAELSPMAPIGPVSLVEVRNVLASRLLEVSLAPAASRYGSVFVAPIEAIRGLCFDVVFVPGLAERLFPRKISEEPILLDDVRVELAERCGVVLATNADRIADERLALRLAVGAARPAGHLVLSYPRLDLDQGRPRVPSFYALEVVRAAEGELPGFDELARRAESLGAARVGWPAPEAPEDAIDEAEHDLALLDSLMRLEPGHGVGTARYLLSANPHLGRALRFRARRWLSGWTVADGLVKPSPAGLQALAAHALSERSYSPTALQHFAACPYRFLLQAVHRLSPRAEPEAIEQIDPLQRGSLFHDVLFELQTALAARGQLPVRPGNLDSARELLDETLDRVAARYRDDLAPAIARVWDDGVDSIRADLREWLRRASEDASGFVPWRFELAFGLSRTSASSATSLASDTSGTPLVSDTSGTSQEWADSRDPHSTPDPVRLDSGLQLRGSADLVERGPDGGLRVTDYKTGRVRVKQDSVVEGGRSLQPVLYALVLEKLFPDKKIESGRLYYCTAAGGFAEREVPLDADARRSAQIVTDAVGEALRTGFLPAAPAKDACRWCDYNVVCGPYEELRSGRKPRGELRSLSRVRGLR